MSKRRLGRYSENADTANAPLSGTDTGVLKVMAVFTQRRALSPQ